MALGADARSFGDRFFLSRCFLICGRHRGSFWEREVLQLRIRFSSFGGGVIMRAGFATVERRVFFTVRFVANRIVVLG